MKFKSFALTFRPLDGVTDEQIAAIEKWCRKKALHYSLITEKTGSARHVHAAIFLKEEQSRSNLVLRLIRLFPDLSLEEKRVWQKGIKVMYNADFLENYMTKGDDTVVISQNLPERSRLDAFFPPRPTENGASKKRKCSLYYHELEELWMKHSPVSSEINTMVVRDFLFRMMYSERILPVIRDDRTIIQVSRHLTRWLNRSEHSTIELPVFEKDE